jgi:hypothetical protein
MPAGHRDPEGTEDDIHGHENGRNGDPTGGSVRLFHILPSFRRKLPEGYNVFPVLSSIIL